MTDDLVLLALWTLLVWSALSVVVASGFSLVVHSARRARQLRPEREADPSVHRAPAQRRPADDLTVSRPTSR